MGIFLDRKGVSEEQFIKMCDAALDGPNESDGGSREFIEILIASQEYSYFVKVSLPS